MSLNRLLSFYFSKFRMNLYLNELMQQLVKILHTDVDVEKLHINLICGHCVRLSTFPPRLCGDISKRCGISGDCSICKTLWMCNRVKGIVFCGN